MPLAARLALILICAGHLPGCAAVTVGGAIVGTTATVVGTSVKATTTVTGAAIDLAIPDDDDEKDED